MINTNIEEIQFFKLDNTIIPNIPFLWYRDEQILCPFNEITVNENTYCITQSHVIKNANIYISLHTLMYNLLYKNNDNTQDKIIIIPSTFNKSMVFSIKIILLEGAIKEIQNGIKLNEFVNGSVFIHDESFSPPGCFHFKINDNTGKIIFICYVESNELKFSGQYKFILYNETIDKKIR